MTSSCRFIVLLALLPLTSCFLQFECNKPSINPNLLVSINLALVSVVSNAPATGFAEFSNPGGVNALAQCAEAVSGQNCADCLAKAAVTLRQSCANFQEAVIWYDSCLLRYSTENFLGNWQVESLYRILPSTEYAESPLFQDAVLQLAETVSNMAVQSGSKLFAAISQPVKEINGVTIYTMAQCTQDLPTSQCQGCLDLLRDDIRSNCENKDGCTLLHTSCILRYGTTIFFT